MTSKEWYLNNREKCLAYQRKYRNEHRDFYREYQKLKSRNWRNNPETREIYLAKRREYLHRPEVYAKNRVLQREYSHRDYVKEKAKKYHSTPEYHKISAQRQAERRQKIKNLVLNFYGANDPKCVCCGEHSKEFLCIDHTDGGGNKHRKELGDNCRGALFYDWLVRNNFPSGYRILCMNCNHSLGLYGYCPHQNNLKY